MCGIVGYTGKRQASDVLIGGLRKLEYRGYDSAGVALFVGNELAIYRAKGKLDELCAVLPKPVPVSTCGIGHTRWATHGRPSETNAHPHRSGRVVVVHNGIIENHLALRERLVAAGREFASETDTEIFAHLIDLELLAGGDDLVDAVRRTLAHVEGSYALGVVDTQQPGRIVAARRSSPLVLGVGEGEVLLASDIPAVLAYTRDVAFLQDGDIIDIAPDASFVVFDAAGNMVERPTRRVSWDPLMAEKGGYPHFLLKEIHEQPRAVSDTLAGRLNLHEGQVTLGDDVLPPEVVRNVRRILLIGCGTSYHAGLAAVYQYEPVLGIPVRAEFASEFRYRDPVVEPDTLVIAISQSGETADTLAAVETARTKGAKVLAVCNVMESSLARNADWVLYTHAGPEISVASTKAFVTQMVSLQLILLHMAAVRGAMDAAAIRRWLEHLAQVPSALERVLKSAPQVAHIARSYASARNMLYLGRGIHFPLALEGALKLKEISYIHAEAYAAGEMKHGPIALIDHEMPVFVIVHSSPVRDKVIANLEEVRARDGKVIALVKPDDDEVRELADDAIVVETLGPEVDAIVLSVPLQLFAYYVAVQRGTDVDQPRNLAKSVTVE